MSVTSASVSHSTLTTAVSRLDLQSDGLDIRSADTPIPKDRLSEETLELLNEVNTRLTKTHKGNKGDNPHTLHSPRQMHILPNHQKKLIMSPAKITGRRFHTIDLPNQISCELSDIVYLITCKMCNRYYVGETGRPSRSRIYEHKLSVTKPKESRTTPVSKHFLGKGHSVKDMQFSILEWCSPKYNTPK